MYLKVFQTWTHTWMAVIPNSTVPPTDSYFWDSSWLTTGATLHFGNAKTFVRQPNQTRAPTSEHWSLKQYFQKWERSLLILTHLSSPDLQSHARLRSALLSPWGLIARLTYRCLLPFVLPLALTSGKQWRRIKQGWARLVQCLCRCVVCRDTLWYSGELLSFFCRLCVIYLTTNLISCQGTMDWCIFYVHTLRSDPQGCGRSI